MANIGTVSSKTVVIILSVLFLAAAIGMWFMGGFVITTYKNISTLASAYYTLVPAAVMIVLGIVFLLGAISGFCSACREGKGCSFLFFVFIFLTFALLITSIALSFVYKREINNIVEKESAKALSKYGFVNETSTTKQIDYLHQHFKCCGSYNYTSWVDTPYGIGTNGTLVPTSCCKHDIPGNRTCDGDLRHMPDGVGIYIYTDGCVAKVEEFLKKNLYYLGAGALAFLILLLLGMIGSCVVMWKTKDTSYFNLGREQ